MFLETTLRDLLYEEFIMISEKSTHILNNSSNLHGFCLLVLTSLKVSTYNELTVIDEVTGFACIFLMASCFFSFLSIRSLKESLVIRFEKIADFIFFLALVLIFAITIMISFSFIF